MAAQEKTDRRSKRTRQALRQALAELVERYGYESITVQQIAAQAGVARTTFYLHFEDKDDLLFRGFAELYDALRAAASPTQMNATADWEHVAAHAGFYRAMLGRQGSAAFAAHLRELLAEVMREQVLRPLVGNGVPRLDIELMAHYLAGAQLGMYTWWLETDMRTPADVMAQAGQDLAVKGLLWGVGIAGSSLEPPG